MSDPNSLGSLVRKRRLESGYSLGQLASKVGKTAAEVRAWERGTELPEHGIIDRLASTLEIDLDEIKARLAEGKKALEAERAAQREAEAAESAEEKMRSEPDEPVEFPAEEEDLPGFAVEDPFAPPPPLDDTIPPVAEEAPPADEPAEDVEAGEGATAEPEDAEPEPRVDTDPDLDLLDAPTEAVPVPIITETATAARAGRAAAVLEEPPPDPLPMVEAAPDEDAGLLRYLEPLRLLFDPNNRYLYWIRAGLTVVVLLIFAVILLNRFGHLLDAIGELLDTIEPSAPDPDDLDALGLTQLG